jgi:hypothetical protein
MAKLIIQDKQVNFEAIPYIQSQVIPGAQKMQNKLKVRFFNEMESKSRQLQDISYLESQWLEYCRQQKDTYLSLLFGYNKMMFKLRRLLLPVLHTKKERYQSMLLVQCETHQEILNTTFKDERHGT